MILSADDITSLYRRHARKMLSFFTRRTYDPDIAVDLVAETFAAAIADRAQFRGATSEEASGWLFGIARHQLSAWYRRGERSYQHVALALDISEQTARARVSRGLRALAQALHDDEDFEGRTTHG